MKNYSFAVDICGTFYGSIEAESMEKAREKLQDDLKIDASFKSDDSVEVCSEWDFKSKCHGNCCSFSGSTDDEYGIDIMEEEND